MQLAGGLFLNDLYRGRELRVCLFVRMRSSTVTQRDGLHTRSVCFCVPAQFQIYISCADWGVGCVWGENVQQLVMEIQDYTHTHSLYVKLLKTSFPVKKSALTSILLLSKHAPTDVLKARSLRGPSAFIRAQMVSSVSPPPTEHTP